TKLLIGKAAAMLIVLIPIVAGIIAYDLHHLPKKLGKKVSQSVNEKLSGEYKKINEQVVSKIYEEFSKTGVEVLAERMGKNSKLEKEIGLLLEKIS
ncbi:MAG: hypothetical protein AAFY41_16940, partial [Bacteroidota bacterium]